MSAVVTYRIEEWSARTEQRVVLGTWGRQTVDRDEALALFSSLTRGHRLFWPHGPRRLVLLAEPHNGAPLNELAAADLLEAVASR